MTMPISKLDNLYQQAESLKAQGRFSEAATCYQMALESAPQSTELWWALGDLYAQTQNFAGVEKCCREVISRNPELPEVYFYLGMALQRLGRPEEAEVALKDALRLNPDAAEFCSLLGVIQQSLGKFDAAIENYSKALPVITDRAPVLFNLSQLSYQQGHVEEAFDQAFDALELTPASLKYRQNFINMLNALAPVEVSDEVLAEILGSFNLPGLDAAPMMKPCMLILAEDGGIQQAVKHAGDGALAALRSGFADGDFNELMSNELFRDVLLHTKIASPEIGILLSALRHLALDDVLNRIPGEEVVLFKQQPGFIEALVTQFFNTDYAAAVMDAETAGLDAVTAKLTQAPDNKEQSFDEVFMARLAVYCMYKPLSTLEGVEHLFDAAGERLYKALPVVVERQWTDFCTERSLREDIETLTPIKAGTSASVRHQYEESPYPRWFSVDLGEPVPYRQFLHSRFPYFDVPDFGAGSIDVLVAGCGTGCHAIASAALYVNSNVLAVDLSKTSLAYAQRKAVEAGVSNVKFAHADILELGSLEKRFHIIESVGVLHHMQDPQAGLKVLTGLLVNGGLMRLGLYSAYGRRAVEAARQFIAEKGFEATEEGVRNGRQALLALDEDHPAQQVTRFRDFYTLSECRDLVFHVQEHRMKIPDLAELLESCGLEFIGFSLGNPQIAALYRERFPDDIALTNLSNWDSFEQDYPNTFEEMYQFWCQKI